MIVLSSFVFSLVMVMLFYALWKFKAKPGDESDGEPIHGNTRLEIAWTLIPTIIVLFGAGYSWIVLDEIEAKEPDAMRVDVFAQQFAWSFGYPGKGNVWTQGELHVPVDRQIQFKLHGDGRDPLLLGAGVADQERQRPGNHDDRGGHPGQGRHLPADLHRALRLRPRDDAGESGGRSSRPTSASGSTALTTPIPPSYLESISGDAEVETQPLGAGGA